MAPALTIDAKRPLIIGNVAGAMEDCPHAMCDFKHCRPQIPELTP